MPLPSASNDYAHAFRVAASAKSIAQAEAKRGEIVDTLVVTLAATMHDIADHKYVGAEAAAKTLDAAMESLAAAGLSRDRVAMVRLIIDNVSFSKVSNLSAHFCRGLPLFSLPQQDTRPWFFKRNFNLCARED